MYTSHTSYLRDKSLRKKLRDGIICISQPALADKRRSGKYVQLKYLSKSSSLRTVVDINLGFSFYGFQR